MPDYRLAVDGELNRQVVWCEFPAGAGRVGEHERGGTDLKIMAVVGDGAGELWHGEAAIEKHERSVIFKTAVRCPFHADELRSEDSESSIAQGDRGPGIGDGVSDFAGRSCDWFGWAMMRLCGERNAEEDSKCECG